MSLGPLSFSPAAFLLLPPVIAALLLLRLYRGRRRVLVTGSLLLWRRLAAQQPPARPRRIVIDRSLLLQALALLLLTAGLAAPSWALGSRGRTLLLVLDNGPLARARLPDGHRLWENVRDEAARILRGLKAEDRVFLARSTPVPVVLNSEALPPRQGIDLLNKQEPGLTHNSGSDILLFAANTARSLGGAGTIPALIVSPANPPDEGGGVSGARPQQIGGEALRWKCAAPAGVTLPNVAIVDFGSVTDFQGTTQETQLLVRLRNFSPHSAEGWVMIKTLNVTNNGDVQRLECSIEALGEVARTFSFGLTGKPLQIQWRRKDGAVDALPEDDSIVVVPRPVRTPRIRFHASVPALERLYRSALQAEILPADDSAEADLDIYSGSVPERAAKNTRALLLLTPERGYQSVFDVGSNTLSHPKAQRDEDDPLTRGIGDSPESSFRIMKACEILRTGDFKTLLKDSVSQRPLAASFLDERGRNGYLLAFVPGAGLPPEQLLEPPLAAMLLRIAHDAAGAGEPYVVTRARTLELQSNQPMATDWLPSAIEPKEGGEGVLDEAASDLRPGTPSAADSAPLEANASAGVSALPFDPWLAALALIVICAEIWLEARDHAQVRRVV